EIAQEVQATVTKLLRRRSSGPAGMRQTIEVLREQVAYLADSADDGTETVRAQDWSRRLDNLDHAVAMLHDTASRREVKVVRQRLHALRGEILAAFVAGQADDAEQRRLGRCSFASLHAMIIWRGCGIVALPLVALLVFELRTLLRTGLLGLDP